MMVNRLTAASSGDFPVSSHLMLSFTNVARPWFFFFCVAGECQSWEFQGGVALLVGLKEQYHIDLGGGGKLFQDVQFWEHEVLDIELKDREILTFGIGGCPPREGR